jgi:hypothetical protein
MNAPLLYSPLFRCIFIAGQSRRNVFRAICSNMYKMVSELLQKLFKSDLKRTNDKIFNTIYLHLQRFLLKLKLFNVVYIYIYVAMSVTCNTKSFS